MALNRISNGVLGQPRSIESYQSAQAQGNSAKTDGPKADRTRQQTPAATDQAEISLLAQESVARRRLLAAGRQEIERLPDVRQEKLAVVRQRLADDFYQSAEVRDKVADRLGRMFIEQDR